MTPPDLTRRKLLGAGAAAGALAATGVVSGSYAGADDRSAGAARGFAALPTDPHSSGIDHFVTVCMENRSFDHFFGWLKGADGKQAGLSYKDDKGRIRKTHHLQVRQGCGMSDPHHSYSSGRMQYNDGKLDGFRLGYQDDFAIGYYTEADLPLYGPLLKQATTFDRYFCSIMGPTQPNRFYLHAAGTDRIKNDLFPFCDLPTIWDRCEDAGVTNRYYFSDIPAIGFWGERHLHRSSPIAQFYLDAAAGLLPQYSMVEPTFIGEGAGSGEDDHPHNDILRGQSFISKVVRAVASSPQWNRTALVITYDEWGGFFEHVKPPRFPDSYGDGPGSKNDHGQAGFRVPCIVVSPYARRGFVGHNVYDHTSILKMVEWRFGLEPLTKRDAAARNLAETFMWDAPDFSRLAVPQVADPGPHSCPDAGLDDYLPTSSRGIHAEVEEDSLWQQMADDVSFMRPWLDILRSPLTQHGKASR